MPRTTDPQVRSILQMEDDGTDLTPFIETAEALVTKACSTKTNPDGSAYYTPAHLEIIERWLAGHFYFVFAPWNLKEEVSESAKAQIESKVDLGLRVTRYGQQAIALDTAGGLAEIDSTVGNPKRGWGAYWLGTRPEDSARRAPGRRGY